MVEFIHAYMTGLQFVAGIIAVTAAVVIFVATYKLD